MFKDEEIVISSKGKVSTEKETVWSRAVQKAKDDLMAEIDTEIFQILDSIAYSDKQ